MRSNLVGKVIVLLLICGGAAGAWRWYNGHAVSPGTGSESSGAVTTAGSPAAAAGGAESGSATSGDLVLITSATKKGWLENEVDRFNSQNSGKPQIVVRYIETRAAMEQILAGKEQPALWSPSSQIWARRLGEAWNDPSVGHPGQPDPVSLDDPAAIRVYLQSPIVFLTTAERARTLRPLLGGSDPWGAIRDLSLGRRRLSGMGGTFRFAHADPLNANSGFLTIGMILADYAGRHNMSAGEAANSRPFGVYLTELEHGLVYDEPVRGGSSALFKAFLDDPSRYGVITTYESNALQATASYPDIAVIYPNPCAMSEQTVVALSGSWVTPQQKQIASDFMDFLGQPDSLKDGVKDDFRTVAGTGATATLNAELQQHADQGFQASVNAEDLPAYAALNDAAFRWRTLIAHK